MVEYHNDGIIINSIVYQINVKSRFKAHLNGKYESLNLNYHEYIRETYKYWK